MSLPAPPQKSVIAELFASVDKDGSGRINAQELQSAFVNSTGRRFSNAACRLMIAIYGGAFGSVDRAGFMDLYTYITQWAEIFRQFDKNGSGLISKVELARAFNTMGYNFSPHLAENIVQMFGRHQVGLAPDQFILAAIFLHNLSLSFKGKDLNGDGKITVCEEDFISMSLNTLAMLANKS